MGPADLSEALAPLARHVDPRLLVGPDTFDDAAVFRLRDDLALVQTVDFFAPIVDDAYDFGRIAAANALSDVYAMGGTPLTALALAAFPENKLPLTLLSEILRGGEDVVRAAGAIVVGGHTISDEEVKYGLAVTGTVHPDQVMSNAGARAGDVLVLTKPLGTGVLATEMKAGALTTERAHALIASMSRLNDVASHAAVQLGVRCATDISGFGLMGHASHVAKASGVTLRFEAASIPALPGAEEALRLGITTGGAKRNERFVLSQIYCAPSVSAVVSALVVDPQTSGGLLLAVPPDRIDEYLALVADAVRIGDVLPRGEHALMLV
ncbi:MAG TPA: selenide, water dikinase SelD [Gemmatimonadaceae bacterium]|jgi:selenide,water dikinase